jgi:hypothetical protein
LGMRRERRPVFAQARRHHGFGIDAEPHVAWQINVAIRANGPPQSIWTGVGYEVSQS